MKSKLVTPGTLLIAVLVAIVLAIPMATEHRKKTLHFGIDGVQPLRTSALTGDRSLRMLSAAFRGGPWIPS